MHLEKNPWCCWCIFVSNSDKEENCHSLNHPHDKLSENHNRLIENFGQYGSDYIRLTKNQIKEKVGIFDHLEQTSTDKNTDALSFLDDLLGPLIKPRKKGRGNVPDTDRSTNYSKRQSFSKDGDLFRD